MKLPSGKRLGQSGYELALAVFFTFFIHAAAIALALLVSFTTIPKKLFPPAYQVKLVGLPQELAPLPASPVEPVPAPPQPEPVKKPAPLPKARKHAAKPVKAAVNKSAIPELSAEKQKPEELPPPTAETTDAQPAVKAPDAKAQATGGSGDNVSIPTPQQDFKDTSGYIDRIRNKIGQYWRPPVDEKDAKARVMFTISRSGQVGNVKIDTENTRGRELFQRAAMRALLDCKQFPPLPEDFPKQSLQFTVDLMAE